MKGYAEKSLFFPLKARMARSSLAALFAVFFLGSWTGFAVAANEGKDIPPARISAQPGAGHASLARLGGLLGRSVTAGGAVHLGLPAGIGNAAPQAAQPEAQKLLIFLQRSQGASAPQGLLPDGRAPPASNVAESVSSFLERYSVQDLERMPLEELNALSAQALEGILGRSAPASAGAAPVPAEAGSEARPALRPADAQTRRSAHERPVPAPSKISAFVAEKWNAPGPEAPGPDDAINVKSLIGLILPRLVGMGAYMIVTLAFVKAAVPVVDWTGYGILMSLSPMSGIAAAYLMGNRIKSMGARNAMIVNGALRVVSLSALPLFHLAGVMNMGSLLVGALAEGFLLSSIMTTEGSFLPALFPAKQLRNINSALFMMFPFIQVVLGLFLHIGRFADRVSPFKVFAGAAAINLFIILPLVWFLIPNTKLASSADPSADGSAEGSADGSANPSPSPSPSPSPTPRKPALSRAAEFFKKNWKEAGLLGAAIGLFIGLTWGLPALAAAGMGGKALAAAAAYMKLHPSLAAPLPIAAALIHWITRSEPYRALRLGRTATVSDEEKALCEKRGQLAAEIAQLRLGGAKMSSINAREDELAAVEDRLRAYRGRQLKTIAMMSLGTLMFYPLYLVATPHIAETLVGKANSGEMTAQFLGALFLGNLISTAARTTLPSFELPLPFGYKLPVNTTRWAQAVVVGIAGLFTATKIVVASTLLGSLGVAAAAMAAAVGLIALASRVSDTGWIKLIGFGFATVWLPFIVWHWPGLIPFLTVKTSMLLSLLAAGYVNGPNFVSHISYLMGNTERSENSKVTGVQGAFFNASISMAYGLLTIASGFLSPAYPAVLAILGVANLAIGAVSWRAPKDMPGLPPEIFIPKSQKAPAAPPPVTKEDVK